MGSFRIAAGSTHNAAKTATLTATSSDANFPLSNLYDGRPGTVWKPSAAADSLYVQADLNIISNGSFATDTTGWTLSAGAGG